MTPEEQRIAIAEACGWKYDHDGFWSYFDAEKQKLLSFASGCCPNYPKDLNAMHEAEKTLNADEWRIYLGFIGGQRTIPRLMSMDEFYACWMATAAQRAEAFLRTLNKWKD